MSGQVGRPKDVPFKTAGKFAYTRFGNKFIVFPYDAVQKDEEEIIKAVNSGYDKGITTVLTMAQHMRLVRLKQYFVQL